MNTDALFKRLEPPPGGAERFARRLDGTAGAAMAAPRWRPVAWAGAACAAAAVVVALFVLRAPDDEAAPVANSELVPAVYDSPAFDRLLGRPLQSEQLTAVVNKQAAAVTELESQNAKVRIYQLN